MIKTSDLVLSELPGFIRDEETYKTFVSFLEAYYGWMEQEGGALDGAEKILSYADIDATLDKFVSYFFNTFMPAFPEDVLADKRKLIRFSKELYESKGNESSFKFLFRALYNTDPEIIETKKFVFKASAGNWFLPKSIKISSNDSRWINAEGLWVVGDISKTFAKIDKARLINSKIEIFISDIERLFQTGENVSVVDLNLLPVYFDPFGNIVDKSEGELLIAKILGTISNILINPSYRGNFYLKNDPVVVYGGMDDESVGIGASAIINEVTLGSIQRVKVENGSFGYRDAANTWIMTTPDSGKPIIIVSDTNFANTINVDVILDSLELKSNVVINCNVVSGKALDSSNSYCFAKTNALSIISNANTIMMNAFSYFSFPTYSIDAVTVENGGGGFRATPIISVDAVYETDMPLNVTEYHDPRFYTGKSFEVASVKGLGILGPIKIRANSTGHVLNGTAYEKGDEIKFVGGLGGGANANVLSVVGGGQFGPINEVKYYKTPNTLFSSVGGFGYTSSEMPIVSVVPKQKTANTTNNSYIILFNSPSPLSNVAVGQTISGNGIPAGTTLISINTGNNTAVLSNVATQNTISNTFFVCGTGADLYVDTVLGDSAKLIPTTDRIGSISSIKVTNYGEDYSSQPSVSMRIQDIAIYNVPLDMTPKRGDIVYQGDSVENAKYKSIVDSINRKTYDLNPLNSTYVLRVYNYTKYPDITQDLKIKKTNIPEPNVISTLFKTDYTYPDKVLSGDYVVKVGENGIVVYGDGTAKANTQYLQGLILGQGRYIDESNHPSSFSVLQNDVFNNFTYIVSVEKEIAKYREILYKLLHPAGTKVLGQTVYLSDNDTMFGLQESTHVNELEDFGFLFAVLATEECEENNYTSEIMRFPESIEKYVYPTNNYNQLIMSTFPNFLQVGKEIVGDGIPIGTVINGVDTINKTITISSPSIQSVSNGIFYCRDIWTGNSLNFVYVTNEFYANTYSACNIVNINSSQNHFYGVLPKQYVNGGFINISANTVNGNSILTSISSTVGIANGQYVSGNNIPNGTRVANISGTNIYLTQPTTGNANGYIMTYLDILSGYIDEYVPNIVTFSSVSNITKADQFFIANNKTLLTTNYYSPKTEDLVYFMGENTERDVFGLPSEFIRIETEGRKEKFVFNVNKYISYTDNVYAYNVSSELNNLITENDEQVIATLYTKIE